MFSKLTRKKLARKIDAEQMVRVNLRLCRDFGQSNEAGGLVPAWQQRISPLDSTQRIRRSSSRGAFPANSSPRTEGWPRTAAYPPASSPLPSVPGASGYSRVAIDHHVDVADFILVPCAAFEMRQAMGALPAALPPTSVSMKPSAGMAATTAAWPVFTCSGPVLFEAQANHGSGSGNLLSLFLG